MLKRKVFTKEVETGLKNIRLEIEKRYEIGYIEIGTDEDHVHFLIQCVPDISPSSFTQTTKSLTAKGIFKQFPEVKTMLWGGKFWTRACYINTVGQYGNEKVIANYVKIRVFSPPRQLFTGNSQFKQFLNIPGYFKGI